MSAPTEHAEMCRRVLDGEHKGAVEQAVEDLDWLESALKQARASLTSGGPQRGAASKLGQSARMAVESLMKVDIVLAKHEGVSLMESEARP